MQNEDLIKYDTILKKLSNHFKKFLKDDTIEISAKLPIKPGILQPNISVCINEKRYIFKTTYSVSIENLLEICKLHSVDPISELISRFEYDFPEIYEKELLEIKLDLLAE